MSLWFATSSTIFHRTWSIVLCNTWISVVSHYKMGWFRSRSFVWNPPGVPMWARWFSPGISIIINHQPSILITTTISIINHHRKTCLKNVNSSWQSHDRNVPMFFSTCFLVGGIPTPLKNMNSSVGMMTFPIYGKIWCSKPPTSYPILVPIKTHKTTLNQGFKPPTSYVFLCFVAPLILPIDPHGLIIHILTAIQVQPLQRC